MYKYKKYCHDTDGEAISSVSWKKESVRHKILVAGASTHDPLMITGGSVDSNGFPHSSYDVSAVLRTPKLICGL